MEPLPLEEETDNESLTGKSAYSLNNMNDNVELFGKNKHSRSDNSTDMDNDDGF